MDFYVGGLNDAVIIELPYRVVSKGGYVPLVKVYSSATSNENWVRFNNRSYASAMGYVLRDLESPNFKNVILKSRRGNKEVCLSTSLLTVSRIERRDLYTINKSNKSKIFMLENSFPEIIMLSAIKTEDVRKIKLHIPNHSLFSVEVPNDLITLFVSEERTSKEYMYEVFSSYFRTGLLKEIRRLSEIVTVKVVPQSYIDSFIEPKIRIESNSLYIHRLVENRVKEKVFSSLLL